MMKVLERVVEGLIRQRVKIDEIKCGFMSGRGTNDAFSLVFCLITSRTTIFSVMLGLVFPLATFTLAPRHALFLQRHASFPSAMPLL